MAARTHILVASGPVSCKKLLESLPRDYLEATSVTLKTLHITFKSSIK